MLPRDHIEDKIPLHELSNNMMNEKETPHDHHKSVLKNKVLITRHPGEPDKRKMADKG